MKAVLIINGSFNQVANTVKEAIKAASDRYRNTFWQEHEDIIEVRSLITEANGYQHSGDAVLFKCGSSRFWAK